MVQVRNFPVRPGDKLHDVNWRLGQILIPAFSAAVGPRIFILVLHFDHASVARGSRKAFNVHIEGAQIQAEQVRHSLPFHV